MLNGCVKQRATQHPTITRLVIIFNLKKKFILVRIRTQFQNYGILYLDLIHRFGFKIMNTERTGILLNVKIKFNKIVQ